VSPSRDAGALAANLRTLSDAATRERLGANARNAVLPLTLEAMTLALVLLYRDLLSSTVKPKVASEPPATASGPPPARGDAAPPAP
jgi:hypothetical protein